VLVALLSTIFVGLQIRQNNKALKATSPHAVTDNFDQINVLIGVDVKAGCIWGHFTKTPKSSTPHPRHISYFSA
jgi:hypothetical protein